MRKRSHQDDSGLQYDGLYPLNLIEDLTQGDVQECRQRTATGCYRLVAVPGATTFVHRRIRYPPCAPAAYHSIHNTSYE